MIAGTLEVQMVANLARLSQDMAQAKGIIGNAAASMESALKLASGALKTLAAGFTLHMFVEFVRGAIDAADHLNDLSKKTGIAVETLGGLGFAAKQAGGNLDTVAEAAGKLNRSIAGAAAGNLEQAEAFKVLGINVKDASGQLKSADRVIAEVADKFEGYADGSNKVALAIRLFGKAGADMIPLLDEGGAKIRENIEYYKRFSGVTAEVAKQADEFNDTMEKIHLLSGAVGTKLAAELLPTLQTLAERMLEAKENSRLFELAAEGVRDIFKYLVVAGANVAYVFAQVGNEIGGMTAQLAALARFDFRAFRDIGDMMKKDAEAARKAIDAFTNRTLNPAVLSAEEVQDRESGGIKALRNGPARQAPGLTDPKAAERELKQYEGALRSLTDQLGALNSATVEEKLRNDFTMGSLKGLTGAHRENLIAVARLIDAKKAQEAADKSATAAIEAHIAAQEAIAAAQTDFFRSSRQTADDIAFETSLIGKNDVQREQSIQLRKIELDWRQKAGAVSEIPDTQKQAAELANLNKTRADAEERIRAEVRARAAAVALNPKNLEQMQFENTLIGMTNTQREQAIALRQLELTGIDQNTEAFKNYVATLKQAIAEKNFAEESKQVLVGMWQDVDRVAHDTFASIFDSGKSAFDRLRDTLKNGLASLLYSLTLRPFIIQVVATTAGPAVAQSVFGTTATQNALSLFSAGNSAYSALSGGGVLGSLFGSAGGYATAVPGLTSAAAGSQAALLAAQTGVFGAEGLAATAGAGGLAGAGALGAIGSALPYVGLALAAGSALGLFGNKSKPAVFTGGRITGTASQSGFDGMYYGTSSSDPNNPLMNQWEYPYHLEQALPGINKVIAGAFDEMKQLAETLKLDTSRLGGVSASFDLTNVGRQPEEIIPVFTQQLGTLTDQIARDLLPTIEQFRQGNESLTATFVRLADEASKADQEMLAAHVEAVTTAQDALRQAYQDQASELQESIAQWTAAAKKLRDYGASLVGVGGGGTYAAAAAKFAITSAQARAGDMGAIGDLQSVSETFRSASLAHSPSALAYARDLARIRSAVSDAAFTAEGEASAADQQLSLLTSQVTSLVSIDDGVKSVAEAIRDLKAEMQSLREVAKNTKASADILDRVSRNGNSLRTETA